MLWDITSKVAGQLSEKFNGFAQDLKTGIQQLNRDFIVPAVRYGKNNRAASAIAGAKIGFAAGLLSCTPFGPAAGAVGGFFVAAVTGPTAMGYIEGWIAPDEKGGVETKSPECVP